MLAQQTSRLLSRLRPGAACSSGTGSLRGLRLGPTGGRLNKKDDCKKLDEAKESSIVCRKPDLRRKKIPPYKYGYCREPETPMLMSCPPKAQKRGKGPCCLDQVDTKKGGCRVSK